MNDLYSCSVGLTVASPYEIKTPVSEAGLSLWRIAYLENVPSKALKGTLGRLLEYTAALKRN